MQNRLFVTLAACLIAACVSALGCNQTSQTGVANVDATPEAITDVSGTSGAGGCCGKCAEEAKASTSEGCCGKCKTDTETKADGCCGKCQAEESADEKGCCGKCQVEVESTNDETQTDAGHVNTMSEDRDIFHYLLQNHEEIRREVTNIDKGVETITESDNAEVVKKLQEHVASMHGRIKDSRRLRMWDDLFVKIFDHADEIEMKVTNIEKGVKVVETSDNPEVVKLIQQHAKVVSGFSEYGFEEAQKNHPADSSNETK